MSKELTAANARIAELETRLTYEKRARERLVRHYTKRRDMHFKRAEQARYERDAANDRAEMVETERKAWRASFYEQDAASEVLQDKLERAEAENCDLRVENDRLRAENDRVCRMLDAGRTHLADANKLLTRVITDKMTPESGVRLLGDIKAHLAAQPSMAPKICQAGRDGECNWAQCPQRDDRITERHCPLDVDEDDERPVTQPATASETDLSDFDEPPTEQTVGDATGLRRNEKKP